MFFIFPSGKNPAALADTAGALAVHFLPFRGSYWGRRFFRGKDYSLGAGRAGAVLGGQVVGPGEDFVAMTTLQHLGDDYGDTGLSMNDAA